MDTNRCNALVHFALLSLEIGEALVTSECVLHFVPVFCMEVLLDRRTCAQMVSIAS